MIKIGLITGYGISFLNSLEKSESISVDTPYGTTSQKIVKGTFAGDEVYILPRHGENNEIPSFLVNYKANIYALHQLGCTHILSTSVCGSLQEELLPGEFIIFDQFIDLSTHKELSFSDKIAFEDLNHSAFNKPFSDDIRDCFIQAAITNGVTIHTKGTVVAVDGPRQSTRAESNLYRSWKADVVNTTTVPEAILAHELNMQYASVSLCNYYETWRTDIAPATRAEKTDIITLNADKMVTILSNTINNLKEE